MVHNLKRLWAQYSSITTGYDFCVRKANNGDATLERNNVVVARFLRNKNANQHLFDFSIQNPHRLDVSKPLSSISSLSAIESQKTSVSVISNSRLLLLRTLHTKFGHMHLRNIQKLLTSSSLKCAGIPSSFSITSSDILNFRCDSCSLGKCRSVSFSSHTPSSRVSTPGSKIIFDLEYVPVASLNNNHYVLSILDDSSRKLFTSYLKTKGEAASYLIWWVKRMQSVYDPPRHVKIARSDSGKEFDNHLVHSFFHDNLTDFKLTPGYTPERNGKVERSHLTVANLTTCVLHASNLHSVMFFWEHAHMYSTHVANETPHSAHSLKFSPNQCWDPFEKRTFISHVHPFGCICYLLRFIAQAVAEQANRGIVGR